MRTSMFRFFGVALFVSLMAAGGAQSRGLRIDTSFGDPTWGKVSVDLSNLPSQLGWPAGLLINPFSSSNPMPISSLPQGTYQSGYIRDPNCTSDPCTLLPGVEVIDIADQSGGSSGFAYDAQAPGWAVPSYNCVPPLDSSGNQPPPYTTFFYACTANPVWAVDLEWTWAGNPEFDAPGTNTYEQLMFFNLGTYPNSKTTPGAPVYDASDYNCAPNDVDYVTGSPCHYHKMGYAQQAWELAFNCGTVPTFDPPPDGTPLPCAGGASLQWQGLLYTASYYVLTTPDPEHPNQGPALNEFVYSNGTLRAPPGWVTWIATSTQLDSPDLEVSAGNPVTLNATVSVGAGLAPATGHVEFFNNGIEILGRVPVHDGKAVFVAKKLPVGSYQIVATYVAQGKHATSTSSPIIVDVN